MSHRTRLYITSIFDAGSSPRDNAANFITTRHDRYHQNTRSSYNRFLRFFRIEKKKRNSPKIHGGTRVPPPFSREVSISKHCTNNHEPNNVNNINNGAHNKHYNNNSFMGVSYYYLRCTHTTHVTHKFV